MANNIYLGKSNNEDVVVGPFIKPLVIAEVGVLAFGDVDRGMAFVDVAVEIGLSVIKFQSFTAENVVGSEDKYWLERLKQRELTMEKFLQIKKYAQSKGLICFATTHNEYDILELVKRGMSIIKIGSGDSNNTRMIDMALTTGNPVIVSLGLLKREDRFRILEKYRNFSNQIIFLHCVTLYPVEPKQAALHVIDEMREFFPEYNIGYSDHTIGTAVPLASISKGVSVIEKHICLDQDKVSPPFESMDITVAITPKEMKKFLNDIDDVYDALTVKEDESVFKKNTSWAQKSIIARRDIEEGAIIKPDDLESRRPYHPEKGHISIADFDGVSGKIASELISKGTFITKKHFK
ncbi:MAG: hypothetical protein COV70_02240 [Parcubacteria group bacterium CG11_big_fil_rev_8_21_14_0_20_39_22]|nr:MAG: hypothetical protein COV70_02240 [Parcubacteria group bacterium CG11_big_fil_rev_8_21_14_0_20_39_22]